MTGWIVLAVYVTGFFIAGRIAYSTSDGDGDDRGYAALAGFIWPVVLAVLAVAGLAMLPTLGAKTRRERRAQDAIRAQAAELERRRLAARIAELEASDRQWRERQGNP